MKKIPIIFFNFGNPDFLDVALLQAKYSNPNTDIYLIGDDSNKKDYVKFIHYSSLMDHDAEIFTKSYVNMSTNNEFYEKICFLRWFLIKKLVKTKQIERFFYADSDVLLYCDINEESEKFKNFRYTLTHNISAGISFINDVSCLDQYCEFVNGVYNSINHGQTLKIGESRSSKYKYYFEKFSNIFRIRKLNLLNGGVCDMTFWGEMRLMDNPGLVGETSTVIDDGTFDHNINATDSYEHSNGIKQFSWRNNLPYCKNLWLNREIQFKCIHFQGAHRKGLMKEYSTYK